VEHENFHEIPLSKKYDGLRQLVPKQVITHHIKHTNVKFLALRTVLRQQALFHPHSGNSQTAVSADDGVAVFKATTAAAEEGFTSADKVQVRLSCATAM
jgi:hypothetical protein